MVEVSKRGAKCRRAQVSVTSCWHIQSWASSRDFTLVYVVMAYVVMARSFSDFALRGAEQRLATVAAAFVKLRRSEELSE